MKSLGTVFCVAMSICAGCALDAGGVTPLEGQFYYPREVALSPSIDGDAPKFVFVANSNYDLRYNAGTLIAFDAEQLASAARECAPSGSECGLDPATFRTGEVRIDSFPGGIGVSHRGNRLYVPSSSSGTVAHIDVSDSGALRCSTGSGTFERCDDSSTDYDSSLADLRGVTQPMDPVGVVVRPLSDFDPAASDDDGDAVLIADRTGAVALYVDTAGDGEPASIKLVDVVRDLPAGVAGFDVSPQRREAWVTSVRTGNIGRVGIVIDTTDQTFERSFLFRSSVMSIRGLSDGQDTRDVAFAPSDSRVVLASRRPESVIIAETSSVQNTLDYDRIIDVDSGPSRIVTMHLGDRDYALVSCYDARVLWVVDLTLNRDVGVVRGFSGPYTLSVDEQRQVLYVIDFRSSTLRVVDLAPLTDDDDLTLPTLLARVGKPYFTGQPR